MTKAYDNSLLARNISVSGSNTSVSGLLSATSGNFTTSLQINGTGVSLSGHSHIIGDVTGLQTSLDSKQASGSYAASSHTHTSSQITDFNSGVSGLVSGVYAPLSGAAFTGPISATSGIFSSGIQISNSGNNYFTNTIGNVWFIGDGAGGGNIMARYQDSSTGALLYFRKYRGSYASPTTAVSGDTIGNLRFETMNYAGATSLGATINSSVDATPVSGEANVATKLTFSTAQGSDSTSVNRMVIKPNGYVGIGTIVPTSLLDVSGTISATSGNFSQNLQINGTGVSLSGHTHTTSAISDSTTVGRALLTGTDATAQRTSLGLGTLATQNGAFSGTSSGTNTGDQSISISGDVTAAGSSSSLNATVTRINGIALSGLSTGLLKNTTSTGAPSIAVAGTDYAVSVTAGSGIAVSSSSGAYTINAKTYSTAIGDGTATTYTITHNLSVANDSFITVRDTTTNYYVYPDIVYVGTNSIQVIFVSAPTTNQYRVTVIGV